ncbi:MAG: acetylxylan esterase [Bryobacterales bacterium]|nr:acetylxylan esterase [Bryobacterales bacterium]
MLPRYLKAKAFKMLDERKQRVTTIGSSQDLYRHKQQFREKFQRLLGGPWPERSPLNARVIGTLDFPDYKIEKTIFESYPGFHITANLYLPKKGSAPYPAILFPLGHEGGAKAHEAWQYVLVSMAKKGYVCLAWDTIGQGERIQMWDDDFKESKARQSTTEHTILGLQTLLVGDPLARYTIYDGLRALDYLSSRPEVDTRRIGVTGNSGGGTHTSYLASLDDRFAAAAPSCYLTNWRRLLETIGPQDAEQCIPPSIAEGLDHPDFVLSFAPKPFLMLTAIRDFFSIAGARETYQEAARIYDSLGASARFGKFEWDDGHGYNKQRRLAAYRFFGKHLQGTEDTEGEPDVKILLEDELWATKSGQVVTEFRNEETVHSLNLKRLAQLPARNPSLESIRRVLGYNPATTPVTTRSYGAIERDKFRIEKLTYEPEPGILIPALLYVPAEAGKRPAVVLAHSAGKAAANATAEQLARDGKVVLSVDLRGMGETNPIAERPLSDWSRAFGDYNSAMTAMLTAKPLVGMRAEDVSRAVDVLRSRPEVDSGAISAYGVEHAAVPVLYAAAFDTRITGVALERMVLSYEAIVRGRWHRYQWENAVTGALKTFDIPDVVRLMNGRAVRLIDPVNPVGQTVQMAEAKRTYPAASIVRRHVASTAVELLR